jgi:hypothetical protein
MRTKVAAIPRIRAAADIAPSSGKRPFFPDVVKALVRPRPLMKRAAKLCAHRPRPIAWFAGAPTYSPRTPTNELDTG